VAGADGQALKTTRLCYAEPTRDNVLRLPDVSGVILTTGSLSDMPAMRFEPGALLEVR
jgi:hypothetical protein